MAGHEPGERGPAHHFPQQDRRKSRCRGVATPADQVRGDAVPVHAWQLENSCRFGGVDEVDPRQKERHRHCDGVVDGRLEPAEPDTSEGTTPAVATVMAFEPLTVLSLRWFRLAKVTHEVS